MENRNKSGAFSYSYSAERREEINRIVEKYTAEGNGIEKLRRLDKSAELPGRIVSLTLGVIGTLALGLGMCCTIEWPGLFAIGVVIGAVGIFMIIAAYPAFSKLTARRRRRLAPQMVKLGNELKSGSAENLPTGTG